MRIRLLAVAAAFSAIFVLSAVPAYAGHELGHDSVARDGIKGLDERVWNLETALPGINSSINGLQSQFDELQPSTKSVNCGASQTIQAALDSAVDGDTFNVSGTCNEAIEIVNNRIQLVGGPEVGPQGASILGPPGVPAISVRGENVRIVGFAAITGGVGGPNPRVEVGIWVRRGASAIIINNTVKDSGWQGIKVRQGSSARIENTTVTNNGSSGIRVVASSAADILGSTITGNAGDGIAIDRASSGAVDGSTISDNGSDGIDVGQNSSLRLSPRLYTNTTNTMERNARFGVRCNEFSTIRVEANQTFGTGVDANNSGDANTTTDCRVSTSSGVIFP